MSKESYEGKERRSDVIENREMLITLRSDIRYLKEDVHEIKVTFKEAIDKIDNKFVTVDQAKPYMWLAGTTLGAYILAIATWIVSSLVSIPGK